MKQRRFGLIEAGGTKFVLGVAHGPGDLAVTLRLPTTSPEETIAAACNHLAAHGPFDAIGIGTFGPVDLDPASPHWGHILATPKPGWTMADLAGPLQQRFGCPVAIDTDVNAAALAESRWGAGPGQRCVIYFTIGTGIGGGAVIDGKTLRGLSHPEMGHIRVARHAADSAFAGHCNFHGDCLEGLASGPAIAARFGASLSNLAPDHVAHDIIAFYLGQLVIAVQAMFEPGCIVMGGGVMGTPGLLDRVRAEATRLGAGYFRGDPAEIVVAPGLGDQSGLMGALALALDTVSVTLKQVRHRPAPT